MATATQSTPMAKLQEIGQSAWIDFMSRKFLDSGELKGMIEEDGLRGATSNPTIFDKAITHSADYDAEIARMVGLGDDDTAIYAALTVADIREALDLFRPVYDQTEALDGYVSLEVDPGLAHDGEGSLTEARKLWGKLNKPNAMIKIPGTEEGLMAIEEALFEGINVNVTLLFSVDAYEKVAKAYVKALKRRADAGKPIDKIASVASFFVSRIDSEVDKRIDAKLKEITDPAKKTALEALKGKIAIANAKNAYVASEAIFGSPEFAELKAKGAMVQRLLWASVGTKNPAYPDTLYIDELIGPDTVSTMPPETYHAFKDHGTAAVTLSKGLDEAKAQIDSLAGFGIDFKDVTTLLLKQGVDSFAKSFDSLMSGLKSKSEKLKADRKSGSTESLGGSGSAADAALDEHKKK